MPDYQKGKIYTIRCHEDPALIYVGSTIQPLSVRWGGHKRDCKNQDNPEVSIDKLMKEKGIDLYYIEWYEDFPCNNKEQLRKREGEVQRLIATVNKRIECRTRHEYNLDNKERIAEYRANNKQRIAEKERIRYENKKDEILQYRATKISCDRCGSIIRRDNLTGHQKTKKCEESSKNNICPIINDE